MILEAAPRITISSDDGHGISDCRNNICMDRYRSSIRLVNNGI